MMQVFFLAFIYLVMDYTELKTFQQISLFLYELVKNNFL